MEIDIQVRQKSATSTNTLAKETSAAQTTELYR
jgi:hypothetical protein